jgi:RNA-directed DNA polymerase
MKLEGKRGKQQMEELSNMDMNESHEHKEEERSLFTMESKDSLRKEEEEKGILGLTLWDINIQAATNKVKSNKGAAGIDGIGVKELDEYMEKNWKEIKKKLELGKYKPQPVKRVEIPKPDGGVRLLGIPTVIDRVIQQAIHQILNPMFDPEFSESSYGFRKNRSTHDAVMQAKEYVKAGHEWVVDIDLEKYFDTINHEYLMKRVGRKVKDKRVLDLIRKYLKSGIMVEGICVVSEEGVPQGSPLSPLLANIMLDDLDKELEKRGHKFVRYADDCNVYVKTQKAGERVMISVTAYLKEALRLKVNQKKSAVARTTERKFLGFTIAWNKKTEEFIIIVSKKAIDKLKEKVRTITRSRTTRNLEERIKELRKCLQGWLVYFSLADVEWQFQNLDGWIRRRLRACQLRQWKQGKTKVRNLMNLGLSRTSARKIASSRKGAWRLSLSPPIHVAMNNDFFDMKGLFNLESSYKHIRLQ